MKKVHYDAAYSITRFKDGRAHLCGDKENIVFGGGPCCTNEWSKVTCKECLKSKDIEEQ